MPPPSIGESDTEGKKKNPPQQVGFPEGNFPLSPAFTFHCSSLTQDGKGHAKVLDYEHMALYA